MFVYPGLSQTELTYIGLSYSMFICFDLSQVVYTYRPLSHA